MPFYMPASTNGWGAGGDLYECSGEARQTDTHTHSMSSLTAVLNSFRMTNLKGEASADGIWEEQDDAIRFQT